MYLPIIPLQAGFVCVMDGTVLLSGVFGDKAQVSGCFPAIGTLLMDYPACLGRHVAMATEEMCVCELMMMMAERSSLDVIHVFSD